MNTSIISRRSSAVLGVVIALFIVTLRFMGRTFLSSAGFGLWTSAANASVTSQFLADPYSSSHLLHGFIFFGLLWFFRKQIGLEWRFLIAGLIEMGWELLENSPLIINRYREATSALGYTGDSILNSCGDLIFCLFGFWLASKFPWKVTLAIALVVEIVMLLLYRDNLTLNVLMLIWPIQAIKTWQLSM
jgi:hypothetical protein